MGQYAKLALFAALFAFMLGCISVQENQMITKPASQVGLFTGATADCEGIGGPTPCTCLVCQNRSVPFYSFTDMSLKGGSCSFVPCNSSIFAGLIDNGEDNKFPSRFLLGQGASFSEFKRANQYCNNSLSLSVKWMVGSNGEPPKTPATQRAECFLDRNVIPLYIYYTNSSAIRQNVATEIGAALGAADGPAIVTTEINFNSSDPAIRSEVKAQILAYKAACPKCLVALSPKDMDWQGVQLFLSDASVKDSIDLVGQGIMLNENTSGLCDVEGLIGKRMEFSRRILKEYNKPTIWLYVGIAPGTQDMEGNEGCSWNNNDVAKAYEYMMGIIQPIASSGVIGYSPYLFSDATAPLPCKGNACNFGIAHANFSAKEPQFSSWFSNCQFYSQGNPSYVSFSTNGQGYQCTFGDNYKMFSKLVSEAGNAYSPQPLGLQPVDSKVSCEACVSYNSSLPRNFGSASSQPREYCESYPQADIVPDRFDVPALLMRAIFSQESSFDACAVSFVPPSGACNPSGIELSSLGQYAGEASCTLPAQQCVKTNPNPNANDQSSNCVACGSSGASATPCKPCAYGLAQCIEYPGQLYVSNRQEIPQALIQCGGETYNPFKPEDSACCGATKLYENLQNARHIVSLYPQLRTSEQKDWYTAYLALMSYHGGIPRTSQAVATYFAGGRQGDTCYASHHDTLVAYLSSCVDYYPVEVLGKYQGLVNACGSADCKRS